MIEIEKPWEIENLGLTSIEYIFDRSDEPNSKALLHIQNSEYDYKICRIYAGQMDLAYKLQDMGFRFAEATVVLDCRLGEDSLPKSYRKYLDHLEAIEANENEINMIVSEIHEGIFDSDRIALDPELGVYKSRKRMGNWLKQESRSKLTKVYVLKLQEKPFGYCAVKSLNNNEASSIQAGLFSDFRSSGLGFATLYFPIVAAKQLGKKKISTEVSSNNVISVRTHLSLGYHVKDFKYVLVRHDHLIKRPIADISGHQLGG